MPVYQVVTRTEQVAEPPRKRVRRISREWSLALRFWRNLSIAALLFVLILTTTGSNYAFVLLPVFLSLFVTGSRGYNLGRGPQSYALSILVNSTPLYLFLTFCLSFVFYSFITAFVLITHPPDLARIIFVTTALAWTVILGPARDYVQGIIEQRFNVRNREAREAVEAFTSTLREEIDIDQLREHFFSLLRQTMQPYFIALWTRVEGEAQMQTGAEERSTITVKNDDPLIPYALTYPGLVELDRLQLDSPVVKRLRAQMTELALLLVSQGELIGLLALGIHLNGEDYTSEERRLLSMLAGQVAPALAVAQMVQEQQEQIRERERIEQELRTAQAIQQAFLPREVPAFPGWQLRPYYRPAREVGGDFYDFFLLKDGKLGLVIGDVTGKGIPAALVMATVHTMLRSTMQETTSPGEVLARVNELLIAEIPEGMFVTCFYAILDPASGHVRYANAGHEPPYRCRAGSAGELWAAGMPLGLMPDIRYEECEATLTPGETLFFYSDGLVEAHAPAGEMFGFPRLQKLLEGHGDGAALVDLLIEKLRQFTGEAWEQEDDVTLLTLQRMDGASSSTIHG